MNLKELAESIEKDLMYSEDGVGGEISCSNDPGIGQGGRMTLMYNFEYGCAKEVISYEHGECPVKENQSNIDVAKEYLEDYIRGDVTICYVGTKGRDHSEVRIFYDIWNKSDGDEERLELVGDGIFSDVYVKD